MLIVLLFLKTGNSSSTRTAVESMHDAKSAQSCPTLCVQPCVTLWTVAHQAPLSVGFSRQEHWSGLPWPPLGDLPDPGFKPMFLMSPALAVRFFTTSTTWEAHYLVLIVP